MQRDALPAGVPLTAPVSPAAWSVAEAAGEDDGDVAELVGAAVTVRSAVGAGVLVELQPASTTPTKRTAGVIAQREFVFMSPAKTNREG